MCVEFQVMHNEQTVLVRRHSGTQNTKHKTRVAARPVEVPPSPKIPLLKLLQQSGQHAEEL